MLNDDRGEEYEVSQAPQRLSLPRRHYRLENVMKILGIVDLVGRDEALPFAAHSTGTMELRQCRPFSTSCHYGAVDFAGVSMRQIEDLPRSQMEHIVTSNKVDTQERGISLPSAADYDGI